MTDDGETPPPRRVHTEHGLSVPIDLDYLHEWRRENKRDNKALSEKVILINERLIEGNFKLEKHDEQIKALAIDLAESDRKADTHHQRIYNLEGLEALRSRLLDAAETAEAKSRWNKFVDSMISQAGVVVIGVIGAAVYIIAKIYFKDPS